MTHEELLAKIDHMWNDDFDYVASCHTNALRAIVELHKPIEDFYDKTLLCDDCTSDEVAFYYPCPTIQAIEKELM